MKYNGKMKENEVREKASVLLPRLFGSKSILNKFLWLLFVTGVSFYCVYAIINYVYDFLDYPVVTEIAVIQDQSPEFPTVRICGHKSIETIWFNNQNRNKDFNLINIDNFCSDFNSGNLLISLDFIDY